MKPTLNKNDAPLTGTLARPSIYDLPNDYERLTECDKAKLCDWLEAHVAESTRLNNRLTSLALTVRYNAATESLATNGQVKGAMMALGYRPAYGIRDERYRIRSKS